MTMGHGQQREMPGLSRCGLLGGTIGPRGSCLSLSILILVVLLVELIIYDVLNRCYSLRPTTKNYAMLLWLIIWYFCYGYFVW